MANERLPESLNGTLAAEVMEALDDYEARFSQIQRRGGDPADVAEILASTQAQTLGLLGKLATEVVRLRQQIDGR